MKNRTDKPTNNQELGHHIDSAINLARIKLYSSVSLNLLSTVHLYRKITDIDSAVESTIKKTNENKSK